MKGNGASIGSEDSEVPTGRSVKEFTFRAGEDPNVTLEREGVVKTDILVLRLGQVIVHSAAKTQRPCGECNLCCTAVGVKEVEKYPNQRCPKMAETGACTIYGFHPSSCKSYACGWKMGNWGEDYRPDRIGVVVSIFPQEDPTEGLYAVMQMTKIHDVNKSANLMALLKQELGEVRSIYDNGKAVIFKGSEVIEKKVERVEGEYEKVAYT